MSINEILSALFLDIVNWHKLKLINVLEQLREEYKKLAKQNDELIKENEKLKKELEKQKIQSVNKNTNQPSSKKPEWEKGTGKDDKNPPKKKKRRRQKPRKGSGNSPKNLTPNNTAVAHVDNCDLCGKDLSDTEPLKTTNDRIIEDIPEPPEETIVTLVSQEKKYCPDCKVVVTAKSDLALPKADIGINATVLICYLWVALCLPYTRIEQYLSRFFQLSISTSGLTRHVIRVSKIMKGVYTEILEIINNGEILQADETGWRVKGRNWWLWVFGTQDTAFFTVDKSRGTNVVRRVLGEIFFGVLVVDGWSAYLSLVCEQQSCLSHIVRKIRKFRDAFPDLTDIVKFYMKFRRIIRDGERLQKNRDQLDELVFKRRLKKLKKRLDDLVKWPDPSNILEEIIKKVKRQQPRILTFVEHPDVPFHNNYAEYLIRIGVLKRKISGGSASAEGAEAYAILLSIYTTCKLRNIAFPIFLKDSLQHYIHTGKTLSLQSYCNMNSIVTDLKKAA